MSRKIYQNEKGQWISETENDEERLGPGMGIRLPLKIDAYVRSLPNRSEWIRKVITEAALAEIASKSDTP
ncbi:MAG: hypothetical protein F6K08_16460 [Okeania sp. SIO1H6]|uniref:hypothetical protein n=1 Tax=Okeania sp. SIO2B3 TaxID=2607784 RepID=UPI0013C28677|nr:hypothetical protein [Okeania sp. SIO2B3]NET14307.1 hypothetical protein [Okeania sp. SIO1H6]NET44151.1 hypothetical protein [Okeania sp. SIO2B3]